MNNNRKYLTNPEINLLLKSAKKNRHGHRDYTMLLLAYMHGLRVSELINIKKSDIDLKTGHFYVRRSKGSMSTTHPLQGNEIRAVRSLLRNTSNNPGDLLFMSERGPFTRQAFNYLLKTTSERAGLTIKAHPHMLRHSCGYELANKGLDTRLIQDWLGHRNISHTVIYTKLNANRFSEVWR